MDILQKLEYALNNIPNKRNVGPNGESSYELMSEHDRIVREARNPDPNNRNGKYDSAVSIAFSVVHEGAEPTEEELLEGMLRRYLMVRENRDELREACEVYDTMDINS